MPKHKITSLQGALRERVKRFRQRLQRLGKHPGEQAVHQFRIACRELLACEPVLRRCIPELSWKSGVKKALHSLGQLRDLQHMQRWLLQTQQLPPDLLAAIFAKPLHKAHLRWERTLPELREAEFTDSISALLKTLRHDSQLALCLQSSWHKQWDKSLLEARKYADSVTDEDIDSLHRLRLRYKQLRYLVELQLDSGTLLTVDRDGLRQWQDELGHVSDFRAMADYAGKLGLPDGLRKQFIKQAFERAKQCKRKRAAFSAFLTELDAQLNLHT